MQPIAIAIKRRRASSVLAVALILLGGCNPFHREPTLAEPISLIAVMPLEPAQPGGAPAAATTEPVSGQAADQVTGQVYAELRKDPDRRLVPDVIVSQAMRGLQPVGDLASRARALGKELEADAVLFGTVSRYTNRESTESEERRPAVVGFELHLISVHSGKILWNGAFLQAQPTPSSTPGRWWQSSAGEPRRLTAQELTRYGTEQVLADLEARLH